MNVSRERVFNALFELANGVTWGAPPRGFQYFARRVKLWADLAGQFPALCQAEHDETVDQVSRLPSKTTLQASWIIYHDAGKDTGAVPATESNLILDAVQALFPGDPENGQTLGGLVHHCWISGRVFKDNGDLDGVALLIVPIKILVP